MTDDDVIIIWYIKKYGDDNSWTTDYIIKRKPSIVEHIDTRYHYIRECVANQEIQVEYVKSQDQSCQYFHKAPQVRWLYQDQDVARNDKSSLGRCWN